MACPNNGDGLAYGCAASNGAAGAFIAFANVLWTPTVGVDDGDTLYICGAHRTELRPLGGAPVTSKIVLDGNCPGDGGNINTRGAVNPNTDAIRFEGAGVEGYVVRNLSVKGARSGILIHGTAPKRGFAIERVIFDQTNAPTTTNACHELSFIGSSSYAYSDITVQNNTFLGASCANRYNDAIHLEKLSSRVLIVGNRVSGIGTAGGVDISGVSTGPYVIARNSIKDTFNVSIRIEGSLGCPSGMTIEDNSIKGYGAWGMSLIDLSNSRIARNTVIGLKPGHPSGAAPPYGAVILRVENACTNTANIFYGNIFESDYLGGVIVDYTGTRKQFEAGNVWNGNLIHQSGPFPTLIGFLTDSVNNVTEGNFSVWRLAHPADRNTAPQNTTPRFRRSWVVPRQSATVTRTVHP
jgi:hypothetical protein